VTETLGHTLKRPVLSDAACRRVFVVDDDPDVCESLAELVALEGLEVEIFRSARAFLLSDAAERGGSLLLDVRMPEMSGLDLQEEIYRRSECLAIVLMSGYATIPTAVQGMRLGAIDFLEKPFSREALRQALSTCQSALTECAREKRRQDAAARRFSSLTGREREVLLLMLAGHPNKLIAHHLNISQRTAEAHRAQIMTKTKTRNLVQLLQLFHDSGLSEERFKTSSGETDCV